MKAACTAAERGHKVFLVEKSDRLGGQLLLNRNIPGREEMATVVEDLLNNLNALKVDILLNKEVNQRFIKTVAPDTVVLATGACPILPDIKGIENERTLQAWDVIRGEAKVGERVVIIGGNAVGLETALTLAHQGTISPEVLYFLLVNRAESWDALEVLTSRGSKDVTVLEMTGRAGKDIGSSSRWTVMAELKRLGVTVMTGAKAIKIGPVGVHIEKDGRMEILPADSVVMACGSRAENRLYREIEDLVPEIYIIGDAKEPRNALSAIKEGFLTGLKI